jgi:hypothetical protein
LATRDPYRSSDSLVTEAADSRAVEAHSARNEGAIHLLESWLNDASGYDEQVWPVLKEAIENDRLSHRKRFTD